MEHNASKQSRAVNAEYQREFSFTEADFAHIQQLIKQHAGIKLTSAKQDMVYARLAKRLRATKLSTFKQYCELASRDSDELVNLINAITTNLTAFFREPHHFEHLKSTIIPELARTKGANRKLRIWSAGCSSGEEPYSIAMAVLEALPQPEQWDIKILASDLDTNMVATAAAGIYSYDRVAGISPARLQRWMSKGKNGNEGKVRSRAELRSIIQFKQLNLMDSWPMQNQFDLIFCRNVVIYFDKPTQRRLFNRYADQLSDHGWLYIGHSEILNDVSDRFQLSGKTIYRKVK